MITIRKANQRGMTQTDWLQSYHTFSFGEYYDPAFMGFSHLRVINEDSVQPSQGFGAHPHRDMEIISYVIEGALAHQDSMGTGSVIKPGEIQRMSAGTGVTHSEFNHSQQDTVHFLQIWIVPKQKSLKPSYEQKTILKQTNQLILIGSQNPQAGAIMIHQDLELYAAYLTNGFSMQSSFNNKHNLWLQLIKGEVEINEHTMFAGDGAAITNENIIQFKCVQESELLLFVLP